MLQAAAWPGNLRQMEMVIRDGYLRARGGALLCLHHLSDLVSLPVRFQRRGNAMANARAITLALEVTGGRVQEAAKLLHAARSTIYTYLGAR